MRRQRLRWLVLALIVAALGGVLYQVSSTLQAQKGKEVDSSSLVGMLPQAVQWIQNFHRIEIRDGRKTWELDADEAQYLEESHRVVVKKPRTRLYLKSGDQVTVTGDLGDIELDGKELQKVTLHDNVEIHVRDYVIHAGNARYERAGDQIFADGPVTITGEALSVEGTDMVVFMKDSRFELQRPVRVTVLPQLTAKRPS